MEVNLLGDPESSRFCGSSVPWACEEHSSSSALSEDEDFSDYASNYHQQGLLYDSSPHLLEYKKLRSYEETVEAEECELPGRVPSNSILNQTYPRKQTEIHGGLTSAHLHHQQHSSISSDGAQHINCMSTESGGEGQQMDLYRDLILRHLIQDISTTCARLHLPTDPLSWSPEQTSRWMGEMCGQFNLETPATSFCLHGKQLMQMNQRDFEMLAPGAGETLYAQLQLWKTAFENYQQQQSGGSLLAASNAGMAAEENGMLNSWSDEAVLSAPSNQLFGMETAKIHRNNMPSSNFQNNGIHGNGYAQHATSTNAHHIIGYYGNPRNGAVVDPTTLSDDCRNAREDAGSLQASSSGHHQDAAYYGNCIMPSPTDSESSGDEMDEEDSSCVGTPSRLHLVNNYDNLEGLIKTEEGIGTSAGGGQAVTVGTTYGRQSGTVHLWHFIRELLDQPKQYSSCVRWVDREQGTFKIESSQSLARYWGCRKNRSQMNYDKLSRSLRQYYKKGIIQKPEKKQRLVYKFLPPYHL